MVTYVNTTHTSLGVNSGHPRGTANFDTTLTVDALPWRLAWWALNSITEQIFGSFVKVMSINEGKDTETEHGTYSFSVSFAAIPTQWYANRPNSWTVVIDTDKLARLTDAELSAVDTALESGEE